MAKAIKRSATKQYADQLDKLKAIKRSGRGSTVVRPARPDFVPPKKAAAAAAAAARRAKPVELDQPDEKASSDKGD